MRIESPVKANRNEPIQDAEDEVTTKSPGADGPGRTGRRRPGRAASLRGIANATRSQRWRNPKKGKRTMRRGNLAKGSRTKK